MPQVVPGSTERQRMSSLFWNVAQPPSRATMTFKYPWLPRRPPPLPVCSHCVRRCAHIYIDIYVHSLAMIILTPIIHQWAEKWGLTPALEAPYGKCSCLDRGSQRLHRV